MAQPAGFSSQAVSSGALSRCLGRCLLLVLLGLAAVSCAEGGETENSHAFTYIDSDGGGKIVMNDVTIEINGSIRYRYQYRSSTPGETSTSATIEGHPFGVRDGVFFMWSSGR